MLGSTVLDLGPLNVPLWLLTAVAAYLAALLVSRFWSPARKELWSRANDLLTTAVIAGFVTWKLAPLATRYPEIVERPLRLLYYPGGTAGVIAGILVALAAGFFALRRKEGPDRSATLVASALILAFVALPVAVVSVIPAGQRAQAAPPAATLEEITDSAGGRPTVLVFWATWCGPCSAQMPEIERFHERNGMKVQTLAVNLTTTEPGPDHVARYMDESGFEVPVVLDQTGELGRAFDVRATPTTVVLDDEGQEHARRTGAVTSAWIERRVLPLRD